MNQPKSPKIYEVRHLAGAAIALDGTAGDPLWQRANLLDDFSFPWKEEVPPRTEFRALCDDEFLYLAYTVEDHDLVLVDDFRDKTDAIKEDRVEIFFALDWRLDGYYCRRRNHRRLDSLDQSRDPDPRFPRSLRLRAVADGQVIK
ncbi:MAG: hypothetical protein NTW96_18100 [Planctomycetia bacterium]|nr:hypothetical protein [Planctomycetia bacterium]